MENQHSNAGQGMGVTALVLGIIGVICSFIPCFGLFATFFGVLAIIFGAVGYNQAKRGNGKTGLPVAGIILGCVATIFTILWILVFAGAAVSESFQELNSM